MAGFGRPWNVKIEQVADPETKAISLLVDGVEVLGSLDENQADMAQLGATKSLERLGIDFTIGEYAHGR